jgi:hypothetical protein
LKVEGSRRGVGEESTNSASLGQPGVRARKCVREDHVAEGVPAPRGKSLEIRGFGGKLSYEILFQSSKTKVFKYKTKYLK